MIASTRWCNQLLLIYKVYYHSTDAMLETIIISVESLLTSID